MPATRTVSQKLATAGPFGTQTRRTKVDEQLALANALGDCEYNAAVAGKKGNIIGGSRILSFDASKKQAERVKFLVSSRS